MQVLHAAARYLDVGRLLHKRRVVGATTVLLALFASASGQAATYPAGFAEQTVLSGLTNPTVVRFAADGRVFVAEKSGLIKVFDSLADPQPDLFADLRTQVHNFWDRGLLGLALHPNFPDSPYVYALYTHDAAIGGTAPRWGAPGGTFDGCPTPPGATGDGCVVSGRLSRLTASGNSMVGTEEVLIEDWCQQYPSHSVGSLDFGADGALYVTGGDGASFNFVDYGQDGNPLNPCGDPPGPPGAVLTPPTAQGGALRSQDLRTPFDPTATPLDPTTLDGALLRVDPATGAALPDNPNAGSSDPNERRIVAYGMRNPFRMGVRPGTNEVWIGDVGWNVWEEINRVTTPTAGVTNLGWPCYEGGMSTALPAQPLSLRQSGYDAANLSICESLYSAGALGRTTAAVRVESLGQSRDRRDLSDRELLGGGNRLRLLEQQLSRRVQRRALLRRLLPRLRLGDDAGREWAARSRADPYLRSGRREPGPSSDRDRRRPLLRGLRRRVRPAGHVHGGEPAAYRGRQREPDERQRPADRPVRRLGLERPRRG